jgi:hypothetical protein
VWTQREGGSARPQAPLYAARGGRCICHLASFEGPRLRVTTFSCRLTASDIRGECILAMLFWVIAVLSVAGAFAIVWGLYLLVRRWL